MLDHKDTPIVTHDASNNDDPSWDVTILDDRQSQKVITDFSMQESDDLRKFFAIALCVLIFLAMVLVLIALLTTGNVYLSLSLFSLAAAPVFFLRRFAMYLLPLPNGDLQLEMKKLEVKLKMKEAKYKAKEKEFESKGVKPAAKDEAKR